MSTSVEFPLSRLVQSMEESATLKMAKIARELKGQGYDIISLSVGEPDFDTPKHIKEAAKEALDAGYTHYTPVPGLIELQKAIVTKFKRDNNLTFETNQIVVSNGAKQSIANVALALLDPGDEVIVFTPFWVSYTEIVKMTGATPVLVEAGIEQDYKVTAAQVEAAITEDTKMVLFSSPCNPTGSVYKYDELQAIAEVLGKYPNIVVVSDEIYECINFTGKHVSIGSFDAVKDRTITVNGFSKGYAMTGWRLGYIGAPKGIADACSKIQGQFTSGANSFSQMAAAHALLADQTSTVEMKDAFLRRRDLVIQHLNQIPGMKTNLPEGAFYIFPDVSNFFGKSHNGMTVNNADDFSEFILQYAHVALVSGTPFGAPNCVRLSYAASDDQLVEAVTRMGKALALLV